MEQDEFSDGNAYVFTRTFWRIINQLKNQIANIVSSGVKNNYNASAPPASTDDANSGYATGSQWIYAGYIWQCTDPTVNNAVWVQIQII